jgi:hypothetical protein
MLWILMLFKLTITPVVETQAASPVWQVIAEGIQYREFYPPEPNHLYVTRMERDNPQVTLETSLANGRISGGLESVRGMVERYDQAINNWGKNWGARNHVVVAINGSFFDPNTGVPWSGIVHSGWYAKRFFERQNGSGFVWTLDRVAFIGGCIVHRKPKQKITNLTTHEVIEFDNINTQRGENDLVIYTPQFDATTQTDDKGIEVMIELSQPLLIMPSPEMITGTVTLIRDEKGATPIYFDHIVLSASGTLRDRLKRSIKISDEIGISQELTHFEPDCQTPNPDSWSKTYASLGGSYVFLRDGVIQGINDLGGILRNPRTAIAYNDKYIYFVVVDGRDRFNSLGMSMVELAVFVKTMLGARWGIAQDGGGSSTIVVNGEVKNHPNVELIDKLVPSQLSTPSANEGQTEMIERFVANGMMMVVVLPKELSQKFKVGDRVVVTSEGEVNVRLGPGTNYGVLSTIIPKSTGVIWDHSGTMNGVLAKGNYWWKVAFGELLGWVSENYLELEVP